MRTTYETDAQVAEERKVADWYEQLHGFTLVKTKRYYPIDFAVCTGAKRDVVGLAEVKCRTHTMDQYDQWGGYMLSAHKWAAAWQLVKVTDVPFHLVVRDSQNDVWLCRRMCDWQHDGIRLMGRTDRKDPDDIEPAVLLRKANFELLGRM
jgi:hypothetical protein